MSKERKTPLIIVCILLFACLAGALFVSIKGSKEPEADNVNANQGISGDEDVNKELPDEITFSRESGISPEEFELELSSDTGKIYYTIDGSSPVDSDSRIEYTGAIKITDRSEDENVLSAINPVLYDAVNVEWKEDKQEYVSTLTLPEKEDVDKITVVRAVVEKEDGTYSKVQGASYFVGNMDEHIEGIEKSCKAAGKDLAVMSISMAEEDLFDEETGIYVKGKIFDEALENFLNSQPMNSWEAVENGRRLDANYKQKGKEWEREAHIDYFETDGTTLTCRLQQNCGIRIQGNYSRSDLQKGFRLIADWDYGDNNFDYSFFGGDTVTWEGKNLDKYKKLVLRNGGNCAFTTKYSDTYWQSLLKDLNCETLSSRPCVVYLNGEYWGLYILQEDYNDDFFEDKYGVDKEQVVAYKGDAETYQSGYKLDEGEVPEGEHENYYLKELENFLTMHIDLKEQADFEELEKIVDVDSFRDYFAVNVWINNKWDWPGKNWTIWKTTEVEEDNPYGDGRWRLCFYDLDFGGVSGQGDAYTNTIKEDNYQEYGLLDLNTKNVVVKTFALLMTNETFRQSFYERLNYLTENNLEKDNAIEVCTRFKDTYSPLYMQFYTRYMGKDQASDLSDNAVYGGYASYQCIVDFLELRSDHIQEMIDWAESVYAEQ